MNKRKIIFLVIAILWMIGIFCFSARNADESTEDSHRIGYIIGHIVRPDFENMPEAEQYEFAESIDFVVRKSAHATEYAVLAILWLGAFYGGRKTWRKSFGLSWLIAVAYAATDEFHQLFVPGRSGKVMDVCIDACGALIGLLIISLLMHIIMWKKEHNSAKK